MPITLRTPATKADIAVKLASMCRAVQREFPKVGNREHPTPWDGAHGSLNLLLTAYEAAP